MGLTGIDWCWVKGSRVDDCSASLNGQNALNGKTITNALNSIASLNRVAVAA